MSGGEVIDGTSHNVDFTSKSLRRRSGTAIVLCCHCQSRTVFSTINAIVVCGSVNLNPLRFIDPAPIAACRADRKCGSHPDRAALFKSYDSDLVRDLRQILILAKDKGDVIQLQVR